MLVVRINAGTTGFAPGVCDRLETYLSSEIVGQNLALRQFVDAVCDHVAKPNPLRPLVISVHGPPGVGKSMLHQHAARALFSKTPHKYNLKCPGNDCKGYKVMFGLDFSFDEREAQHKALKHSIANHVKAFPQSLLVIEEYDKLDCPMRAFFRQALEGSEDFANVSLSHAIVILESNTGYLRLHDISRNAKKRSKIKPEQVQHMLKDIVFEQWYSEGCEDRIDTLKMVGHVDHFLPFFPLEKEHIKSIFELRLRKRSDELREQKLGALHWDESITDFLAGKVQYENGFAIDGGKEVGTLMTAYVTYPVRKWTRLQQNKLMDAKKDKEFNRTDPEPVGCGQFNIDEDGLLFLRERRTCSSKIEL